MCNETKQAQAVDLMAENLVTHLMARLEEKGILSSEEVDEICTLAERDTQKDEMSGKFADAAVE